MLEAEAMVDVGVFGSEGKVEPKMPTGRSTAVQEISRLVRSVAVHDSSVLILGESGTGKEVVARAIHDSSPRRNRPFVAINCGAIPADLLESELFGHEKGAFTGAVSTRKGRFEIAEGGTLFLDEIGDMSLPMQVKLLRVLQERVFERVGNHVQMRCNVRIIAATHRNLEDSIVRGGFRQDLFYRLNVFPIEMPALRERLADLPALVEDFVGQNALEGRGRLAFTAAAMHTLSAYEWPGNVRELANLVERLSILHSGRLVDVRDLPPRYRPANAVVEALPVVIEAATDEADDAALSDAEALCLLESPSGQPALTELPVEGLDLRRHLDTIERSLIQQALDRSSGTVAHAARLLGLRRTTLVEKLRKLGDASMDRAGVLTDVGNCRAAV